MDDVIKDIEKWTFENRFRQYLKTESKNPKWYDDIKSCVGMIAIGPLCAVLGAAVVLFAWDGCNTFYQGC